MELCHVLPRVRAEDEMAAATVVDLPWLAQASTMGGEQPQWNLRTIKHVRVMASLLDARRWEEVGRAPCY